MKLLRLQARDFRCFEHLDLDLNMDGLVAVVGDNGAGKSTIFAAIEWGLYGGVRGRGALPVRRDGCPDDAECWVEVHFEIGGRAYGARRVDGKQARLFDLPTRDEICSGRDSTSREVAMLLGLTRDMFRGTFYARQREVQALDSDNEVKRREQVELLLGIERLRRATAHAQTAAKEQRHVVATVEAGVPDVDALRAEAERLAQEASRDESVRQAETALEQSKHRREQAKTKLDALRAQEREMIERRGHTHAAATEAQQQRLAVQTVSEQLAQAERAREELVRLTPVAGRIEALTAAEREMDRKRDNHERAAGLRTRQHQALTIAARAADQLAELRSTQMVAGVADNGNGNDVPQARVEAVEDEIATLHSALGELSKALPITVQRVQQVRERIARSERAAQLDAELATLPGAEQAVDDALDQWHTLTARRTQLDEAIKHDTEHRDAVLAGETQAACPTCKRAYDDGELHEILAGYERALRAAREQLPELDRELAERKRAGTRLRQRAEQLRALAADRRAITNVPAVTELATLREQLDRDVVEAEKLARDEQRCEARLSELATLLPLLRIQARQAAERLQQIASLEAQREQAEREARVAASDLHGVGVDGYEAETHVRLSSELAEAGAASQRCAELRGKVDGLDTLRHRLREQRGIADAAEKRRAELEVELAQVAVGPAVLSAAKEAGQLAELEVDAAHTALLEANRQATLDSKALAAANTRLQDARKQNAQLREQRAELRVRAEVAEALGAFREEASRRARPTLEHETGLLLGQTTRQRYNSVQLTASYQLEIVDGDQIHPLRRFSGGEQDLAGLCLRLALSRTLARQRGAETGFVMLDEVFGSQDADRRRALLEQLHAIADSEFRQVFVISHTDDVVEHCDLRIDVGRGDGGTSAAVGPRR